MGDITVQWFAPAFAQRLPLWTKVFGNGRTLRKPMRLEIETEQLRLIACDRELLGQAIAGDAQLEKYLNVTVPKNWSQFGRRVLRYALEKLQADEASLGWWTYFPIHKADNVLIGSGGYQGRPNSDGAVEIGYEIRKEHRNRGLATELARGLINHAFAQAEVKLIRAYTLGVVNASTQVLTKCGLTKTSELADQENGQIWRWELQRANWSKR